MFGRYQKVHDLVGMAHEYRHGRRRFKQWEQRRGWARTELKAESTASGEAHIDLEATWNTGTWHYPPSVTWRSYEHTACKQERGHYREAPRALLTAGRLCLRQQVRRQMCLPPPHHSSPSLCSLPFPPHPSLPATHQHQDTQERKPFFDLYLFPLWIICLLFCLFYFYLWGQGILTGFQVSTFSLLINPVHAGSE